MSAERPKVGAGLIALTIVVWLSITVGAVFMVVYTKVTGVVFAFIVYVVGVAVWSRVVRDYTSPQSPASVELALGELRQQLASLDAKVEGLRRSLEE